MQDPQKSKLSIRSTLDQPQTHDRQSSKSSSLQPHSNQVFLEDPGYTAMDSRQSQVTARRFSALKAFDILKEPH